MKTNSVLMMVLALTGCAVPQWPPAPTPQRIEAVCRWAAYLTALNAGPANVEPLRQSATALKELSAAERLTPGAVALALRAAGMTWIQCPEGVLALEMTLVFDDATTGPARVEDEAGLRAVARGVSSGIDAALAVLDGDGTVSEQQMEREALSRRASKR